MASDKVRFKGSLQGVYETTTRTTYPLEIGYAVLPSDLVVVDQKATTDACIKGCNLYNRNGGCPPFSPGFTEISGDEILFVYAKLQTKYYPKRVLNGTFYTRWVFVETFMTSLTNRIGKAVALSLGSKFISSGNCHACRPKRCAVKEGKKCRKPLDRTYSLEATGVLVTEITEPCFGFKLQWWRKEEPDYIPQYMAKVIGVKKETSFQYDETVNTLREALKKDRFKLLDAE